MITRKIEGIYGGLVDDSPMPFVSMKINPGEVAVILEVNPDALEGNDEQPKQFEEVKPKRQATLIVFKSGAEMFVERPIDEVYELLALEGNKGANIPAA